MIFPQKKSPAAGCFFICTPQKVHFDDFSYSFRLWRGILLPVNQLFGAPHDWQIGRDGLCQKKTAEGRQIFREVFEKSISPLLSNDLKNMQHKKYHYVSKFKKNTQKVSLFITVLFKRFISWNSRVTPPKAAKKMQDFAAKCGGNTGFPSKAR